MQYLIILAIIVIIISLLFKLIKIIFEKIFDFIIVALPFVVGCVLILLCIGIVMKVKHMIKTKYIVYAAIIIIVWCLLRSIGSRLKKIMIGWNEKRLRKYLDKTYASFGYITFDEIFVSKRYQNAVYPKGLTYKEILRDYLQMETETAFLKLVDLIYEIVKKQGMIELQTVKCHAFDQFTNVVYIKPYDDLFIEAVNLLVEKNKIDRPSFDKNALHCVGAVSGENFIQRDFGDLGL